MDSCAPRCAWGPSGTGCARRRGNQHSRCSRHPPAIRVPGCDRKRSRFGISSALPIGSGMRSRGGSPRLRASRLRSRGSSCNPQSRGVSRRSGAGIRDSHSSALASENVRTWPESSSGTCGGSRRTRGHMSAYGTGCSTSVGLSDSRGTHLGAAYEARLDRRVPSRPRRGSRRNLRGLQRIDVSAYWV